VTEQVGHIRDVAKIITQRQAAVRSLDRVTLPGMVVRKARTHAEILRLCAQKRQLRSRIRTEFRCAAREPDDFFDYHE
jgi:hypothetical protein